MKLFLRYLVPVLFALIPLGAAQGQTWPTKPITIIVPFAPGGATDVMARLFAPEIEREVGQPVVVENKVGAGGTIGTQFVARAPNDGHTFLWGTIATHGIGPNIYSKLTYDAFKDFAPVIKAVDQPYVLVAHPSVGVKDLKALIGKAKSAPGTISAGNAGLGTAAHIFMEKFQNDTDTNFLHVPYKGAGPAMVDLIGGQLDVAFDVILTTAPYIQEGRLVPLAVTSSERSVRLPDVPTLQEAGIPNFVAVGWNGLFAPAGTPDVAVQGVNAAMNKALKSEGIRSRLLADGSIPGGGTPEEFKQFVEQELKVWGDVARAANVKLD